MTIAVGRGKPVGVGSPASGVQIGLEALCATNYLNPNVEDRFVHVISHEYAHVQHQHSDDKRRAIREILEMTDPRAFLAKSGWYPGVLLGQVQIRSGLPSSKPLKSQP